VLTVSAQPMVEVDDEPAGPVATATNARETSAALMTRWNLGVDLGEN
jgi:hypothetical protein